ncbi:MAG TPA: YqgE/AlgH family protein [Bacteroidales bacterium]|nr:YqgE/AlgH family protein [Bacteroidales bacterium]
MDRQRTKPKQGSILISEPSLRDFYFRQSVVLLAEHNEEGSFGVIVNKPIDARLKDIVSGFRDYDLPVFLGGPVKTDSIFFIHTRTDIPESMPIMQGLFWGGDLDAVKNLLDASAIRDHEIRFFVGYSGWSPNQLDRELREKSWVLSQTSIPEIINDHPQTLWSNYLKNMGKDYAIWANFPADPTNN